MSLIILFSIFTIFQKTKEYYSLRYGNIILDYYDSVDCLNKSIDRVLYPVPENRKNITILNSDSELKSYFYSFDFYSSEIKYTNGTGDEDEEEEEYLYKRSFICNGLCLKRYNNSDILVTPDTTFAPSYSELSDNYRFYSCIYNNIIKTATINITRYTDNKCKNKFEDENEHYSFNGTELCWNLNANYSFRPLYYEDTNNQLYYHPYNSSDCRSNNIEYFTINSNYLICNSKCHKNRIDLNTYYKCTFKDNNGYVLITKKLLIFLLLFFMF